MTLFLHQMAYAISHRVDYKHFFIPFAILLATSSLQAQCSFLNEDFSTNPPLSATNVNDAWYPDRYRPAAFEADAGRLKISISAADGAQLRPGGFTSGFYNTQGRKFNQCGKCTTIAKGDLYIPSDWAGKKRRTDMWATGFNASDAAILYPIIGFRNVTGTNPNLAYWDGAWIELGPPAAYDTWYTFEFRLSGTNLEYLIDDVVVGTISAGGAIYFGDIIMQAFNFNDNTLGVSYDSNPATNSYDAFWDNISTTGATVVTNLNTSESFCTIQSAINDPQTLDGHTLVVSAGVYTENITVNKNLTIQGPNAGTSGNAVRLAEAQIFNGKISIPAANTVVIDGFHIYQTNNEASAISLGGSAVATIQNSIIERFGITTGASVRGIEISNGAGAKVIKDNKFTGDTSGGLFGGHKTWNSGMYVNGGPTVSINIMGNVFENCRTAINIDDMSGGISVSGNTFQNSGTYMAFGGTVPTSGSFTLGANEFKTPVSTFANLSNVSTTFRLDITSSTLEGAAFNTLSLAQLFAVEATMFHRGRSGRNGLVYYVANTQYVIPINPSIQLAIDYANAGGIINIADGSYNQRLVVSKSLTLDGQSEAGTILNGTSLGNGKGIAINTGITNVSIKDLTIQNFLGSGGNADAGIYAIGGNNNLSVEHVTIQNNVGGSGFYANGPITDVTLDYVTASGHTVGARGIVIWNGLKSNITITNCTVFNNNCCGIELQDGNATGVTMTGNNVYNNGDNGIGVVGLAGPSTNTVSSNTVTDNGRFGIEVKNPNGFTTVSGNTVSRTVPIGAETRDIAGIAVFRRGVTSGNVDIPDGVTVSGNNVSGYVQPSNSEGFGIVIEGRNHTVTGNTVTGNDVGIQQQAGHTPYPGDGDQANLADQFFGRGNSPQVCGNTISGNTLGNTLDTRNISVGGGLVTNTNTSETFCSIQSAINDPQTLNGHTLVVSANTYHEDVLVNKQLTIIGAGIDASYIIGPKGADGATVRVSASGAIIEGFTITRDGNNPTDWNDPTLNFAGIAVQGMTSNAEVRNCKITGNRSGIDINNSNGNNIHNNIITNNHTGLIFRNQTDNTNLSENIITDNRTVGVLFLDASGGTNSPVQSAANSTFNNNNISGNWYGEVVDRQAGGSLPAPGMNLKNFECNWYGSTGPATSTANSSEPGYAALIPVVFGGTATAPSGQPDILGPGFANIDFSPYLTDGIDDMPATTGFQPVSGACNGTPVVIVSAVADHIICSETTGSIVVTFSGGIANYMVSWTGGSASGITGSPYTITNLAAGVYSITVTDANGFSAVTSTTVQSLPVTNVTQTTYHATIQAAINAASANDVISVCAGTYAEDLTVNKALSLRGPNYNISPNTGSRVAEAVIVPATSAIAALVMVDVTASNVTIDGFTIDGDNPALTSGYMGTNGADLDAAEAVAVYVDNVNNLAVSNNIIRNVSYFGVTLFGASFSAAATSGHLVNDNRMENLGTYDAGSGIASWGGGVLLYNNQYTRITNNVVNNARTGVQTGNFSRANIGAASFQVIDNNTFNVRRLGIFHNLHYGPTSPYTLSNNSITAINSASETVWDGILLGSLSVGSTSQNNTIDGSATAGKPTQGYEVWNVKNTSPAVITGGSVVGVETGLFVNNFDGYSSNAGDGAHATVSNLSITPVATGTGIRVLDNPGSTHANVQLGIGAGMSVSNGARGLVVENTSASITALGNLAFSGQSGNYIELINNAGNLSGTTLTFEGQTAAMANVATNYDIEDKILHAIDNASLGFVTVVANHAYVTGNSFSAPATTTPSVQRAIDVVANPGTVRIEGGNYTPGTMNATGKDLTFAPGESPACATVGNMTLNSGDVLDIEIDGTTACTQHDQFIVNGTVSLGGATLTAALGYTPGSADQIILISNDGADPVAGQFAQGNYINISGTDFYINYAGGVGGNDVVLVPACSNCAGGTFVGNVTINTQAQLVAFRDGSGCRYTQVTGNLTLNGNDATDPITDLCNLEELTTVTGNFIIRRFNNAANPTNLSSLANLTTVGGTFTIGGAAAGDANTVFTAITLPGLSTVGTTLTIARNSAATAINVNALTEVSTSDIDVTNNAALQTISIGASGLTLGRDFLINGNDAANLASITSTVTTVGRNLNFDNNNSNNPGAVISLPNLVSVASTLTIDDIATGTLNLPLLSTVGVNLYIRNNDNGLTTVTLPALASVGDLGTVTGDFLVSSNNVLETLNTTGSNFTVGRDASFTSNNTGATIAGGLTTVNLSGLTQTGRDVIVTNSNRNTNGAAVSANSLTNVGRNFRIENVANSISATAAGLTVGGYVSIDDNNSLCDLNLSGLTTVTEYVVITDNYDACGSQSIDVSGLQLINGYLTVSGNDDLPSLNFTALAAVNGVGTGNRSIDITNNDNEMTSLSLPVLNTATMAAVRVNGNAALTSISMPLLPSVGQDLRLEDNNLVASIDFGALTAVSGILNIDDEDLLTDLSGFAALISTGGNFIINGNGALVSTDGMVALTTIGGNFNITSNPQLGTCCIVPCQLTTINGSSFPYTGNITITGNKSFATGGRCINNGATPATTVAQTACAPAISDFSATETSGTANDNTVCFGDDIDLSVTASTFSGVLNYEFFADANNSGDYDAGDVLLCSGASATCSFSSNLLSAGTHTISVRVSVSGGCEAYPLSPITLTINALPTATIMASMGNVCTGDAITLDGNPVAGTATLASPIHAWSVTGGTGAGSFNPLSADANPIGFNASVGGTVDLLYVVTDDYGCQGSDIETITVVPAGMSCAGPITFTGNITLSTQSALNSFVGPGGCKYTHITGNLTIVGYDGVSDPIINMCNLTELVSVGGSLVIRDFNNAMNPNNLGDLANLQFVGAGPGIGNLTIGGSLSNYNPQLGLISLPSLASVDGTVTISFNNGGFAINLPALQSVTTDLDIVSNGVLGSVVVGTGTTTIGRDFVINGNDSPNLSVIDANIATVGRNLTFDNNNSSGGTTIVMTNLSAVGGNATISEIATGTLSLPALATVGGTLSIANNDNGLTTVTLPALASVGDLGTMTGDLGVSNNNVLETVNTTGSNFTVGRDVSITGNNTGVAIAGGLTTVNLSGLTETGRDIIITNSNRNTNGTAVSVNSLTDVGRNFRIEAVANSISATAAGLTVGGYVNIDDNDALCNLNLSGLTTVAGYVEIVNNYDACGSQSIDVSGLQSIGGYLTVSGNDDMPSLNFTALAAVNGVGTGNRSIDITNNDNEMTSLAFPALNTATPGALRVNGNASLASISAPLLPSIGQDLRLEDNNLVASIDFGALTTVGGILNIDDEDQLTDLSGLAALVSTGGNFIINGNGALVSTDGMVALMTIGGNFNITSNPQLGTCCIVPCQLTTINGSSFPYTGNITITGNKSFATGGRCINNGATPATEVAQTNCGPTGNITGLTEVCLNGTITLNGNPSGGVGPFTSHMWTITGGTGAASIVNNNDGTADFTGTMAGTVQVQYIVMNASGCSNAPATFTFTVDAPPSLVGCLSNLSINTDNNGTGDCTATFLWGHPTVSGLAASCGPAVLTVDYTPDLPGEGVVTPGASVMQTFAALSTTVAYTLTDAAGNIATCSFVVTVNDNEDPLISTCPVNRSFTGCDPGVITGPVYSATVANSTYAEFSDATNQGVATDNCGIVSVTYQDATSGTCPVVVMRTWTLEDAEGNEVSCIQTITINAPAVVLTCPANVTESSCPDQTALNAAYSAWLASASFAGGCNATLTNDAPPNISACGGSVTVTFTVASDCEADVTCVRTFTVDPAPMAVFATTSNTTIACGSAPPTPTSLAYTNGASGDCEIAGFVTSTISGSHDECGGSYLESWTFTDECSRTITAMRTITVDPAPIAVFATTSNTTIACGSAPPTPTSLAYTNSASGACEITGSVMSTISGSHDECGGSYTESWTFTDACSRTITAMRTITVDPAPIAVFATTSNTTIACGSAPPTPTSLSYTNGANGACEIAGFVTSTISGSHDECGGSYLESWTFTDACSRTITAMRTITVDPAPMAVFATTSNTTIACGSAPPTPTSLAYTNSASGACIISGSVTSTISGSHDECGGSYLESWTFTDECSRTITAMRTITVDPAPMAVFATTSNTTIACGSGPPTPTSLAYTNSASSACEITGFVTSTITGSHDECGGSYLESWTFTDDCSRTITASRTITVDPAPMAVFAATSNTTIACGSAPPTPTSLAYTNSASGACIISGSVTSTISGSHDECGGSYTESWTFTDDCSRTITASRTITVGPAPVAVFATTSNVTIACGSAPPTPTSLAYTNSASGACIISGSVMGTITGSHDECGGSYTESWTFTDACSRTITAMRTITVDPAPVAVFATTSNTTIACGSAPPTPTSLAYTNSASGACTISGSVMSTITGSHDECGGSYLESWTFTDACSRTITAMRTITVDPAPVAVFATTSNTTIACGSAPPTPTSLAYTNSASGACEITGSVMSTISGSHNECGGSYTESWTFTDACSRTITAMRTIMVDPAPMAVFATTSNTTIACGSAPPVPTSLSYTNGASGACEITGSVMSTISGSHDECGGSYLESWTFTDACSRTITAMRTITVDPAPMAVFTTTSNTTIACGSAPPTATSLSYTNSASGACEITGSVMSTITGSHDECGGSYTESWTFTDACSRTITAMRTITVDPAPMAVFATTSNTTIACGSAPPTPTSLAYTNSASGACEIEGSVMSTISGSHDECGGSYTESWTFTDECSRTITAMRTINVDPAPVAVFATTSNMTIACGSAPPMPTSLAYTNSASGACEITGSVMSTITGSHDECGGSYTESWTFTDACSRTITAMRTITVDPAPMAVFATTSNTTIACGSAPPTPTSLA